MAIYDGYMRFEWSHSYSKVYYPKGKYDPRGVFLYFENYNVELRERVKCISATEGKLNLTGCAICFLVIGQNIIRFRYRVPIYSQPIFPSFMSHLFSI